MKKTYDVEVDCANCAGKDGGSRKEYRGRQERNFEFYDLEVKGGI